VQTVISLDQMARSEKPQYGDLKMTIAQFFRVNGGTTQLRGVTPDIAYPSFVDADSYGESSYDNALPWVQIKPANYHTVGNLKDVQAMLQMRHEMRIAKDKEFQFINEDIAEFKKQKEKKVISLNEDERRVERDLREKKIKDREAIRATLESKGKPADKKSDAAAKLATQDDGLQGNERSLAAELAAEKANKEAKDVFLIEAANILSDEIELIKSNKRLADKSTARTNVKLKEAN
jgi:carboxyl-terminal processing protease